MANWQLKTTFLAIRTKISLNGWIFFYILKKYGIGNIQAQSHDSSYDIFFLNAKYVFFDKILVFWPANREKKFKWKKKKKIIFPTYIPSIKNGGHLNLKTCPKILHLPLPLIWRSYTIYILYAHFWVIYQSCFRYISCKNVIYKQLNKCSIHVNVLFENSHYV